MTQNDIAQVQASFRAVAQIKQQAASMFYGRLFEIAPGTRKLFVHTDLEVQGGKLMAAIGFVVGSLRQPEAMLGTVRALAARHVGYGVTDEHYASVGAALIWTLERGLGDAWTPRLSAAWTEAYTMLSRVMMDAAREAQAATDTAAA